VTGAVDLVLWDIDLTLIQTGGIGREIYATVLPQVLGVPLRDLPPMHGRTELDIAHDALRRHDVPASPDAARRILVALAREFRRRADDLRARSSLLPGVAAALSLVGGRTDMIQSLVTGNVREIARLKLDATGIAGHFRWSCGGFGDENRERSELVRLAGRRTRTAGAAVRRVVVVGDTPNDVAAALAAGAHAVGVATGRFSVADLRDAGAHVALDDLSDTDRVRAALGVA
jgi:phosphoglycolate phosphatase